MSSGVLLSVVVVYIQCSLVYDSVAGRQHLLSLNTNSFIDSCVRSWSDKCHDVVNISSS